MRAVLTNELFGRSEFIYNESGIKMPLSKKTMLEARLVKRLRAIGLSTFGEYCNYLFSPEGVANELVHMIDVVTTNKSGGNSLTISPKLSISACAQAILPRIRLK
jgi:chemotaxis protein methyltransferase CheR